MDFAKILEWLAAYPAWLRWAVTGWLVFGVFLSACLMFVKPTVTPEQPPSQATVQSVDVQNSPGSPVYQAGRDIYVAPPAQPAPAEPIVTIYLPFPEQLKQAKERIRYLAYDHFKQRKLSLGLVVGGDGDGVLDNPKRFNWPKVIEALEASGHIKVTKRTATDVAFLVAREPQQWNAP